MDKTFEVIHVNDTIWATEYLINGKKIMLSKHATTIDISSPIEITRLLARLDEAIEQQAPLSAFSTEINLHNLFRLLTAFYYNESLECWKRFFDDQSEQEKFMSAFEKFFGFRYCVNYCDTDTRLFDDFRSYAKKSISLRSLKAADSIYANAEGFFVERTGIKSNICSFLINNNQIDICLSGRQQFRSAQTLLEAIQRLKTAIEELQYEQVKSIVNILGGKAVIELSALFFADSMASLIKTYALDQVQRFRKQLQPSKTVKTFFGSCTTVNHPYSSYLLSMLEGLIPAANRMLVSNNNTEIASSKDVWILYEEFANGVSKFVVTFRGPPKYIHIVQEFCRKTANEYATQQRKYCKMLQRIARCASIAVDGLTALGFQITTFSCLYSFNIKALKTYLSQIGNYSLSTQKEILVYVRALYNFENDLVGAKPKQLFPGQLFPKIHPNPTNPLPSEAILMLPDLLKDAPEVIQLSVGLFLATGARAESICRLTTDDLINDNNKWKIKITLWKTISRSNVPFLLCDIEKRFALQLKQYIEKTEYLRAMLDEPYILVYQSPRYREGSMRKPLVVNADILSSYFANNLPDLNAYDKDGQKISCTPRTLRASFGHELHLEGISDDEAARRMGNSPGIKAKHYTNLCPAEKASELHAQYEQTIVPILQDTPILPVPTQRTVMYGACDSSEPCNSNNCTECSYLLTCKSKPGQKRGDVNAQQLINST